MKNQNQNFRIRARIFLPLSVMLLCSICLFSCTEESFAPEATPFPTTAFSPAPVRVEMAVDTAPALTALPAPTFTPAPSSYKTALYESDGVQVLFLERDVNFAGQRWSIQVENQRESSVALHPQYTIIDGIVVDAYVPDSIAAGTTTETFLYFEAEDLRIANIDSLHAIEMELAVFDIDSYAYLPQTHYASLMFPDVEPKTAEDIGGKPLYNANGIMITAISIRSYLEGWPCLSWVVENDSDTPLRFVIVEARVNGSSKPWLIYDETLPAHTKSYKGAEILFLSEIQKNNNIKSLRFSVWVYDPSSDATEPLYQLGPFTINATDDGSIK